MGALGAWKDNEILSRRSLAVALCRARSRLRRASESKDSAPERGLVLASRELAGLEDTAQQCEGLGAVAKCFALDLSRSGA